MVNAFPWDTAPRYLIRDRDQIYGRYFSWRVARRGIEQVLTTPRSPWQSPYVERVIDPHVLAKRLKNRSIDRIFQALQLYGMVNKIGCYELVQYGYAGGVSVLLRGHDTFTIVGAKEWKQLQERR